MEVPIISFAGELYIQDGVTDLRSPTGEPMKPQPKYIKTTLEDLERQGIAVHIHHLDKSKSFLEIGFTAPRVGKDAFGKKIPFYSIIEDQASESEKEMLNDISRIFADKFKQYVQGCKAIKQNNKI